MIFNPYQGLNIPQLKINMRVKWPKILATDSERLVYHDTVPLLNETILCVLHICDAKKMVTTYWNTVKHVGKIEM